MSIFLKVSQDFVIQIANGKKEIKEGQSFHVYFSVPESFWINRTNPHFYDYFALRNSGAGKDGYLSFNSDLKDIHAYNETMNFGGRDRYSVIGRRGDIPGTLYGWSQAYSLKSSDGDEGPEVLKVELLFYQRYNGGFVSVLAIDSIIVRDYVDEPQPDFRTLTKKQTYTLSLVYDYNGNLHGGSNHSKTASSYKYQHLLDINGDGTKEAIYTNKVSGRWVSASVDSITGAVDFLDYGQGGGTRVVGIYDDPLIAVGDANGGFLSDGVTPAPASFGVPDSERYVIVDDIRVDRLTLNSQVRFQNDLSNDNLEAKASGDFDSDGITEVYWKTLDGTAYLRALMHADGNIRYANYQNEQQMSDYLTANGHGSTVSDIV